MLIPFEIYNQNDKLKENVTNNPKSKTFPLAANINTAPASPNDNEPSPISRKRKQPKVKQQIPQKEETDIESTPLLHDLNKPKNIPVERSLTQT